MGTGVRTHLTATGPYLLAAALILGTPKFALALAAAAGFGVIRGALPLMRYASPDAATWDAVIEKWSSQIVRYSALAAGLAVVFVVTGPNSLQT